MINKVNAWEEFEGNIGLCKEFPFVLYVILQWVARLTWTCNSCTGTAGLNKVSVA